MENNLEQPSIEPVEASQQGIFDTKFNEAIDALGNVLEKHQLSHAICIVFDENDEYKPKVFFRGELFEIVKHTSKVLNQMKYKIMNELNGNF